MKCNRPLHRILLKPLAMVRRALVWLDSRLDSTRVRPNVPMSRQISHTRWMETLQQLANKPGMRILEIGSREVTGKSRAREIFSQASYTGFDFYDGRNVDVVGDAHRLSSYFRPDEKFDLIYSSACFEHFAMPWVVAQEIAKMLKIGGLVFVETHYSYCAHERPWHFFQFSDMALRVLFSPAMGFECIEAGASNPLIARFSSLAAPYLRNMSVPNLYCHSEFLGKKVREVNDLDWANAPLGELVGETLYPAPDKEDSQE